MGITIHESISVLPNFFTAKVLMGKERNRKEEAEYYPDRGDVTRPVFPGCLIRLRSDCGTLHFVSYLIIETDDVT